MTKKIITFLLLMMIIFSAISTFAYSNDQYEIQIPESFSSELNNYMQNYWGDNEGNSVNIQITEIKNANEFQYSEEFLNALIDEIKNNIGDYKQEIKNELIAEYESSLSELNISREEIEEIIDPIVENMEYKDFLAKEVTTFTKNNYPCLHYISNLAIGDESTYTDTYQFVSGKTGYTLTISSKDPKFFEKQEIKDMVNSFTLKDYKEYAFAQKKSNIVTRYIVYAVVGGTCAVLGAIIKNKGNKKKEEA